MTETKMKTLGELAKELRSRAWEDRQHRKLRDEAADRLERIEKAWLAFEAWHDDHYDALPPIAAWLPKHHDRWEGFSAAWSTRPAPQVEDLVKALRRCVGVLAGEDMTKQALIDALTLGRAALAAYRRGQ